MPASVRSFLHGPAARAALVGASALLALPALELGYRLHSHRPVLAMDDWRTGRIEDVNFGAWVRFDAELGWVTRDEIASPDYNTFEHGIRRNFSETKVRTGGILAVGDVLTGGGDEVPDGETWPAHLERLTGMPVLNGGVAGYASDQIILRAERLLPVAQPRTLVVGMFEETIERARYAFFGAAKPYYTIDRGGLVYHPPAQLQERPQAHWQGTLRDVLGYSAVLDVVLAHTAPAYWLGKAGEQVLRTADNDPVAVTCALLQRLKARADAGGVRVLLLMQHARKTLAERTEPREDAAKVAACASALGLEVVDQFGVLRSAVAANAGALDDLYLQGPGFGQMSAKGNRATAELLAAAIGRAAAPGK